MDEEALAVAAEPEVPAFEPASPLIVLIPALPRCGLWWGALQGAGVALALEPLPRPCFLLCIPASARAAPGRINFSDTHLEIRRSVINGLVGRERWVL